jgi:hypothetical protein
MSYQFYMLFALNGTRKGFDSGGMTRQCRGHWYMIPPTKASGLAWSILWLTSKVAPRERGFLSAAISCT